MKEDLLLTFLKRSWGKASGFDQEVETGAMGKAR